MQKIKVNKKSPSLKERIEQKERTENPLKNMVDVMKHIRKLEKRIEILEKSQLPGTPQTGKGKESKL